MATQHIAADESDPHARLDRTPAAVPGGYIAGRIAIVEPLHAETPHHTTAHLLVELDQIGLSDRPSLQDTGGPGIGRDQDAVCRARVQVNVVIERRSEAVQKGDGAESRTATVGVLASLVTPAAAHRSRSLRAIKV